jgi:hypothetical protein
MREELKSYIAEKKILKFLPLHIRRSYGSFDFNNLERKEIYPQKDWVPLFYLFMSIATIIRRDSMRKEIRIPVFNETPAEIRSGSYFIEYPKIKNDFAYVNTSNRYFPTLSSNFLLGNNVSRLIVKAKEDRRETFTIFPGVIFFGEEIVAMIATKETLSLFENQIDPKHFKMPTDFSSLYGLFISRTFSKDFPNFFQNLWKGIAVPMIGLGCSVFMVERQQEISQYFFPRSQQFKNMMPYTYKKKITEMVTSSQDPFEGLYRAHIRRANPIIF